MRFTSVLLAMALGSLAAAPVTVQTAAERLEKAIYTEETVGDLEAAVKAYREILATTKARPYLAQAQYRLAACLERKGDVGAAQEEFAKVVDEYPEQRDLAARARERLAGAPSLGPAPWQDGEELEFEIRLGSPGARVGTVVSSIEPVDQAGKPAWSVRTVRYSDGLTLSQLTLERDSMRPLTSFQRDSLLGEAHARYEARRIVIDAPGRPGREVAVERPVFDQEELLYLVRRLPLAPGQSIPLEFFHAAAAGRAWTWLRVTGIEEVEVPAGTYRAYKVELDPPEQTFWIGVDGARYLLKFQDGLVTAQLTSVGRRDGQSPARYDDAETGFSVSAPPGWRFRQHGRPANGRTVWALDPEASGEAFVWSNRRPLDGETVEAALKRLSDTMIENRTLGLGGYKVRAGGCEARRIAGREGWSCLADYEANGRRMVEQTSWVRTETTALNVTLRAPADRFAAFRERAEPIVQSLDVK